MAKFIEVTNTDNENVLVNVDEISRIENMEVENKEELLNNMEEGFLGNIINLNLLGDNVKNEYKKSIETRKNAKACIELRHLGFHDESRDIYTLNSYNELKLLLMD